MKSCQIRQAGEYPKTATSKGNVLTNELRGSLMHRHARVPVYSVNKVLQDIP